MKWDMHNLPDAILLLGPTGSGKTPLGEALQAEGLGGRRCAHFDFGQRLRAIVSGDEPADDLSPADREVLRGSLVTGALLEEEHFPIAEAILRAFLAARPAGPDDWVILNGLPRHRGQAEAMAGLVRVRAVVELACDAETASARIRADAGGDRAGRADDDAESVARKVKNYAARTAPLVDYYRRLGAAVITIPVGASSTADRCREFLEKRLGDRMGGADVPQWSPPC
jgi:adenylate kinase family enzyme